jgi:hypothetical protein
MRTAKLLGLSLLVLSLPMAGCYVYTTDPPPPAVIIVPAGGPPPQYAPPQYPLPPAPSGPPSGYIGPPMP